MGTGLLYFVRNDGRRGTGLPRFARNDGERGTGLPRFARNDGRRETGLPCFVRNDGRRGLDCHASLAMTGRGVAGESKTLKKFEKICFISLWEYT